MPPDSKFLWEEGMCVKSFKLVKNGIFQEEGWSYHTSMQECSSAYDLPLHQVSRPASTSYAGSLQLGGLHFVGLLPLACNAAHLPSTLVS